LVFSLFRRDQKCVIAAAQGGFELTPCAIQRAGNSSVLPGVIETFLEQNSFEFAAELRPHGRLLEEKAPETGIFNFVAEFAETLLAVSEALHH
jgi:hypothetical protein